MIFTTLYPSPFVYPALSGKGLGNHGEDSALSRHCPIYQGANSRAIYFCVNFDLEFIWHGGAEYEIVYPAWVDEAYQGSKRAWIDMVRAEFPDPQPGVSATQWWKSPDRPIGGSKGGGAMLHAGGLMIIFFSGLQATIPEKKMLMVGPAVNFRSSPNWTILSGAYPSTYRGELSFNFQVMATGVRSRLPAGMPFASGVLIDEAPPESAAMDVDPESVYPHYLTKYR